MSLPRVPKMEERARKTQALEALTHLRPLLRARRNHKKYLQNGFFSGLLILSSHRMSRAFGVLQDLAGVALLTTDQRCCPYRRRKAED
jgi:hypothetical protein